MAGHRWITRPLRCVSCVPLRCVSCVVVPGTARRVTAVPLPVSGHPRALAGTPGASVVPEIPMGDGTGHGIGFDKLDVVEWIHFCNSRESTLGMRNLNSGEWEDVFWHKYYEVERVCVLDTV